MATISEFRTKWAEKLWPKSPEVVYETLRTDARHSPGKDDLEDVPLVSDAAGTAALSREVAATLRWFKLSTTILASILVFVCLSWAAREMKIQRIPSDRALYSATGEKIKYRYKGTPEFFSPAQDAVEWKATVFHNGFHGDVTPWQGPPSDEGDKAWDSIYRGIGVIKIPKSDAERLPNKTLPIPGEDDGYITGLEVYHQLHCLDFVRRAMYPARYGGDKGMSEDKKKEFWIHVDHCIDNLRQTIMCYSDITTIPWKVNEKLQMEFPDAHTTHMCRDFDKITEWMLDPVRHFPQEKYQLRLEALHAASQ